MQLFLRSLHPSTGWIHLETIIACLSVQHNLFLISKTYENKPWDWYAYLKWKPSYGSSRLVHLPSLPPRSCNKDAFDNASFVSSFISDMDKVNWIKTATNQRRSRYVFAVLLEDMCLGQTFAYRAEDKICIDFSGPIIIYIVRLGCELAHQDIVLHLDTQFMPEVTQSPLDCGSIRIHVTCSLPRAIPFRVLMIYKKDVIRSTGEQIAVLWIAAPSEPRLNSRPAIMYWK